MLEHRKMLRRLLPLLVVVLLGTIALCAGGCNRGGEQGPAYPQPIRDEKEPGESIDTVSAVPDTGSSGVEEMSGGSSETEIEVDEDSSDSGDNASKDGDKSAGKSDDEQSGDDEGNEGETGDEPAEPGDIDVELEP